MEVLILAGGLGTRLRSVVKDRPKPMADIQDKPFLSYLLDFWIAQGATHFVLSIGYLGNVIQDYFHDNYCGVPISYAIESTPLGTGGGLALGLEQLKTPNICFVQNGDTFFRTDVAALLHFHAAKNAIFTLALRHTETNLRYTAAKINASGRLISFVSGNGGQDILTNAGIYCLDPIALKREFATFKKRSFSLEEDFLTQLANEKHLPVFAKVLDGYFIDIGIPSAYTGIVFSELTGES